MNNAKMWLVVRPTVGVPLFLTAVAVGSFAVHVAVVTNTSWVANFLKGQDMAAIETNTNVAASKSILDQAVADSSVREATITFEDGRTAKIVFDKAEPDSKTLAAIVGE